MEDTTRIEGNSVPVGARAAEKTFKRLEERRRDCGLEKGRSHTFINSDQQQLFHTARIECLSHLKGGASAFIEVKVDALELLYDLLIFDPLELATANELTSFTKGLEEVMERIEEKLPHLQANYAKVYSAALDCLVCHHSLGHLSTVIEGTKQLLKAAPEILKKLNKNDPQAQFYVAYAIEASAKVTSDRTKTDKILTAFVHFAKACYAGHKLDFKATLKEFRATISEMHFQKFWYEGILFQRKMLREVWDSPEALAAFQQVVAEWGLEKKKGVAVSDWKFLMGTIDCLTDLVLHSPNPKVARNAFYGSYGGTAPGLLDLIEFKAFKIRKKVKMFDTNWRIRYATANALYAVWIDGPEELKITASETLLRHRAREDDERVSSFIDHLLGEDRSLQRSWKKRIMAEDRELSELAVAAKAPAVESEKIRLQPSNAPVHRELYFAAAQGDVGRVARFIEDGGSVNAQHDERNTPLHAAVDEGHKEVVRLLLNHGASCGIPNSNGLSPAEIAVEREDTPIFALLAPKIPSRLCYPLYKKAVQQGRRGCLKVMLSTENFLTAKTRKGEHLWDLVLVDQKPELLRPLVRHIPISLRYEYLAKTIGGENSEILSILLDNSAFTQTKTEEGKFLWDLALDENKEKIVSSLLPHIPSKLRYPYFRTAVNEERSTVIELLANDSSFCEGHNGKRLWDLALEEGDVPTVQRLATRIPEQDRYPFFKNSIESKQAGITTVLTSSSDFILTTNKEGKHFWDLALQEDDNCSLSPLLTKIPPDLCYPFLKRAAQSERAHFFNLLLATSSFVQTKDAKGNYIWDLALRDEDPSLVEKLLSHWSAGNETPLVKTLNLRSLKFTHKKNVLSALNLFTNLEELHFTSCSWLTDDEMPLFTRLGSLRTLNIGMTEQVTNDGFQNLKGLTKLTRLDLSYCNGLTGDGFFHGRALENSLIFTALERLLNVTDATRPTGGGFFHASGLAHIAHLINLRELNLHCCNEITDNALKYLTSLTALERLDLGGCEKLSEGAFSRLSRNLTALEGLYLWYWPQLTDDGLGHIERFPALKHLLLSDCEKVSYKAIAALKQRKKTLKIDLRGGCEHLEEESESDDDLL